MYLHGNSITTLRLCFIGIVGEVEDNGEEKSYFMWAHKKFDIGYSDNQVCHCIKSHLCICVPMLSVYAYTYVGVLFSGVCNICTCVHKYIACHMNICGRYGTTIHM